MPKTKMFRCEKCKKDVAAIWRITMLGCVIELCDKCKEEIKVKIEGMKK